MSGKRYTDEFKIEAVKQVTERGHSVADVAQRLGITTHSLYAWRAKFEKPDVVRQAELDQSAEVRRLKTELKRITEERDILKKAAARSTGRCNTFLLISNKGGLTNGTNGTAWFADRRQGGSVAAVAGR